MNNYSKFDIENGIIQLKAGFTNIVSSFIHSKINNYVLNISLSNDFINSIFNELIEGVSIKDNIISIDNINIKVICYKDSIVFSRI